MKRPLVFLCFAGAALLAAQTDPGLLARSRSGLLADSSEGRLEVATIVFEVRKGDAPQGELTFAAEHHGQGARARSYPHLVVLLPSFTSVVFGPKNVTLVGEGRCNDEEVRIEAKAFDGGPGGHGDRFEITCRSAGGTEVFWASGRVVTGDISIPGGRR